MSFGFPAYYKKTLNPANIGAFRDDLEEALATLPFSILQKNDDLIILKAGWSVWSWGEKIFIDFSRPDQVTIISQCVFPLQCVDYGKNKENVATLIHAIY